MKRWLLIALLAIVVLLLTWLIAASLVRPVGYSTPGTSSALPPLSPKSPEKAYTEAMKDPNTAYFVTVDNNIQAIFWDARRFYVWVDHLSDTNPYSILKPTADTMLFSANDLTVSAKFIPRMLPAEVFKVMPIVSAPPAFVDLDATITTLRTRIVKDTDQAYTAFKHNDLPLAKASAISIAAAVDRLLDARRALWQLAIANKVDTSWHRLNGLQPPTEAPDPPVFSEDTRPYAP